MGTDREYSKGYSKGNKDKFDVTRAESSLINKIVLGYSMAESDLGKTLEALAKRGASVHYLISKEGVQYQLHNDYMKTFHSGKGNFNTESVNETGISIMLLNDDISEYPAVQIDKLISLVKELQEKHNIPSENVIGMNEANLNQPYSPGLFFPWDRLAENNIGKVVGSLEDISEICYENLPSDQVLSHQANLALYGYPVVVNGEWDKETDHYTLAANIRYGHFNSSCFSDKAFYIGEHIIKPSGDQESTSPTGEL